MSWISENKLLDKGGGLAEADKKKARENNST